MASYDFDWVDAFAVAPMGGNACAVVHAADDVSVDLRTALVRETRLSECAFLVTSDVADFGARFYVAEDEIPMAGHPTVATVLSLVDRGMVTLSGGRADFTLEVGAGILPIEVEMRDGRPHVTMTQPRPQFGAIHEPAEVAALFGLEAEDVLDRPATVSTGTPFCILPLRDHAALRRARLDFELLARMTARPDVDFRRVFLTVPRGITRAGHTFSRLPMAPPEPAEDSFTGSATGCMAAYLWARGHLDTPRFLAEQGHWMDRPGTAEVEVLGSRDDIRGVRVGGSGRILMRGRLEL